MSGSVDVVVDLLMWSGKVAGKEGLRGRGVGEGAMAEERERRGIRERDGVEPAAEGGE